MAYLRRSAWAALGVVALSGLSGTSAGAQTADSALFAVTFTTGPAWDPARTPGEQPFMGEHSRNLFRLRDDGTIAAGGRFGEFGLVVVRARSMDAARELFQADPAVANGVFAMRIEPWLTIFDGCIPAGRPSGDALSPAAAAAVASTDRRSS